MQSLSTFFFFPSHYPEGRGNWVPDGCVVAVMDENSGEVTCYCTHLTNFALLVVSKMVLLCCS